MKIASSYNARLAAGQIRPDAAQAAVLPSLQRLADDLAQPSKGFFIFKKKPVAARGIYLWGGVGRGKSMLMDLLCADLEVRHWRVHFHAFMQWVHAELAAARKEGTHDAILPVADKLAADIRFLALDEMQITDITDAMIVGRLFERLLEKGVSFMTTSNRAPEELYKNGLNRQLFLPFIALLREKLEVIELDSLNDHRQGRQTGEARYFVGRSAHVEMDMLWSEAGAPQQGLNLEVHGRVLHFPNAGGAKLRASFEDLCGRPLGAADYLALAAEVHELYLDDIPRLGPANHDRAKRFVTLLDALYEGKVKLFASAAAEPEDLYQAGEGSFEFERSASRLREMQDKSWGERRQ